MAYSLDDAAKAKSESDALAKHNKATDDLKEAAGVQIASACCDQKALCCEL